MAMVDTEYLAYAVRGHLGAHVHANRYIVTALSSDVAVFDTVSKTSRAFNISPLMTGSAGVGPCFSWDGRLFIVGSIRATNNWGILELHLSSGEADLHPVGISHVNTNGRACQTVVVGNKLWICGTSRTGVVDLPTMTSGSSTTGSGFVAGNTVYVGTTRRDAATGAALTSGSTAAPNWGNTRVEVVGGVAYATIGTNTTIARWDLATETSLTSVTSASYGQLYKASDGNLWSATTAGVRAYNPVTGTLRQESFTTGRQERVAVVEVANAMWAPSGYPI